MFREIDFTIKNKKQILLAFISFKSSCQCIMSYAEIGTLFWSIVVGGCFVVFSCVWVYSNIVSR